MKELLENLPPDCPLPAAIDCNCDVFLVFPVKSIEQQHCLSQAERNRAKNVTGDAVCNRHGLSVFPTVESCVHQMKLLPHLGSYIGTAKLCPEHGKIAETASRINPAHMTWWPYKDTQRHAIFRIMEAS